ncbi:olfactory receptor 2B6-like [Gastrophryne carolinensis]
MLKNLSIRGLQSNIKENLVLSPALQEANTAIYDGVRSYEKMAKKNVTAVKEFVLLGLSSDPTIQIVLSVIFSVMYVITLTANSLIILVTFLDSKLQTMMYFFLTNLSLVDIFYSSSVVPRMLRDLLAAKKTILFGECLVQMFICFAVGVTECLLLAALAYDRYIAICYPLHYRTIVNKSTCIKISTAAWEFGFLASTACLALVLNVDFCGSNIINHFLCEIPEILALGCGDVVTGKFVLFVCGVLVQILPISFIVTSYIIIVRAIFKISSSAGRKKAFSTCSSHIMVVTLFYGPGMANYLKPQSETSADRDKYFAIFYTAVTPMLNPLIYTLRNKEVMVALRKKFVQHIHYK